MNSFIKISLIIMSLVISISPQSDEEILWGEKAIEWEDFKGMPPENYNTTMGAYTTTKIKTEYFSSKDRVQKTKVYCYFNQNKSWALLNDDYSLAHERLHFDIAEIYARKIRKAFDSLATNEITEMSKYSEVFKLYDNLLGAYNHEYDSNVYGNKQKQAEWSEKIKNELKALEEYEYLPFND